MKEMYTLSAHINYLKRYEFLFFGVILYIFTVVMFYGYFIGFYVDGEAIPKYSFCVTIAIVNFTNTFACSMMVLFYVTIHIKFIIFNEYIRYHALVNQFRRNLYNQFTMFQL